MKLSPEEVFTRGTPKTRYFKDYFTPILMKYYNIVKLHVWSSRRESKIKKVFVLDFHGFIKQKEDFV